MDKYLAHHGVLGMRIIMELLLPLERNDMVRMLRVRFRNRKQRRILFRKLLNGMLKHTLQRMLLNFKKPMLN